MTVELWLFRHGETAGNRKKQYIGRTEESLTAEGREDLEKCYRETMTRFTERSQREAEHRTDTPMVFSLVFRSPMLRCQESEAVFRSLYAESLPPAESTRVITDWREMDFGIFEGKCYEELKDTAAYREWLSDMGGMIPGGESQGQFIRRVREGFSEAEAVFRTWQEQQHALPNKSVPLRGIAFVHGGTIMALLHELTGEDYFSFHVKNGGGVRLLLSEEAEGRREVRWEFL